MSTGSCPALSVGTPSVFTTGEAATPAVHNTVALGTLFPCGSEMLPPNVTRAVEAVVAAGVDLSRIRVEITKAGSTEWDSV